jgi:hypothetical protein
MRIMRQGAASYAESLQALVDQVADATAEIGTFNVTYDENGISASVGLRGRKFATRNGAIGAFALPKLLRYAARMGIPGLVDIDMKSAHVHAMWELAGCDLQAQSPQLRALRGSRDEWVAKHLHTMPESDVDYDSFKQLILAVLNGKRPRQSWPKELHDLATECQVIRTMLARKHPEIVKELKKCKRDPVVSTTALLMIDLEQKYLERMIQAAGSTLMSIEHDGVVVRDASPEVLAKIEASVPWPVHRSTYPWTQEEFLAFAAKQEANYDWCLKSKIPWEDVLRARQSCELVLASRGGKDKEDEEKFHFAHTDFATVIASRLEGDVVVEHGRIKFFNSDTCTWNFDGTDNELHDFVRTQLHTTFRGRHLAFEDYRPIWKAHGQVHPLLKSHANITPVRAEVKSMLCGKTPDACDLRRMLPFKNGIIYDFAQGRAYKVHRGLAPNRVVPWDHESWQLDGQVQKEFADVVNDMLTWERNGGGDLVPEPPTGDIEQDLKLHKGNPGLAERFVNVLRKIPGAGFVTRWFDAGGASYFLQHYVRMLAAEPKFCEMLNVHGPPRSGKDAMAALFESHMGNIDEGGFGGGLMPEQVQIPARGASTARSSNGPTPFTHALKDARSVIVPELKREVLDMELLKGIVEQEGAKITSRQCRGNVNRWNPSALLVTIGNYCPDFGESPPDGTERRVNVLAMKNRFAVQADPESMVLQGDFDLKAKINKGLIFNDFFHVAKAFYPFLALYGDKIRRPRIVEADTAEALAPRTTASVEEPWYMQIFMPADDEHEALQPLQVRQATFEKLALRRMTDATTELKKEGFNLDARDVTGKNRCVKFKFPGTSKAVPVAMKR